MTNPYYSLPASDAFLVVPSDTVDFTRTARGIYVGGAGNVTLVTAEGTTVLFTAPPVGSVIPVMTRRVNSTATTATVLIALV